MTAQEELESRPIEVIVCANEAHVMIRAWAVVGGGCRRSRGRCVNLFEDASCMFHHVEILFLLHLMYVSTVLM